MRRFIQVLAVVCVMVLGVSTIGMAQVNDELIENMQVTKIISAEVRPVSESGTHYLYVVAELKNTNEKELKLTKANFDFYIQYTDNRDMVKVGPAACIYDPIPEPFQFACAGTKDDILLPANTAAKYVMFAIDIENPEFETIIHILNFLGKHPADEYFFIEGKFDLGIKSSRGWTYAEALRVEWMFCPETREDLPLEPCFPE